MLPAAIQTGLGFTEGSHAGMQSQSGKRAGARPSNVLDQARSAWSGGDFVGCLQRLDARRVSREGSEVWVEATLLRARSLYRLRRYPETIALLEPVLSRFAQGDESCTAGMLLGSSVARSGSVDRGLDILEATAARADEGTVHRAIRAEIAHARAIAHYRRREHDESERLARLAETADADIISVRATQLRGFIALTQQRFVDALALFNLTLDAYWRCRERDADLAEMTIYEIAALELTLRSQPVTGTHAFADRRKVRDPWDATPEVASVTRLQTFVFDAWLFAHDGDRATAFRKMRRAEEMASDPAWRVWALAGRAALAAAFGEFGSAREHAAHATELAQDVQWAATTGEERVALLLLAETLAVTDPDVGTSIVRIYDDVCSDMNPEHALASDPRLVAFEEYVRGLLSRANGDHATAKRLLKSAARRFAACGHLWRAALAFYESASALPTDNADETARAIVAEHFPNSFLAQRIGIDPMSDPIVAGLTPAQRDVLALLLDGRNARDIATTTGRAYNTVRVHIDRLREAFGASSIHALVVDCHRRGIVLRLARTARGFKAEALRSYA